jgi:hypothetical protein
LETNDGRKEGSYETKKEKEMKPKLLEVLLENLCKNCCYLNTDERLPKICLHPKPKERRCVKYNRVSGAVYSFIYTSEKKEEK